MGESIVHMNLVGKLADWIAKSLLDGKYGYLYIENPGNPVEKKPQLVNGFVPDVMAIKAPGYDCIIGEAKTADDIDNQHTLDQVEAFLSKCAEFKDSYFVFAVPWYRVGLAKAVIKYCCKNISVYNVRTRVLEKLSG